MARQLHFPGKYYRAINGDGTTRDGFRNHTGISESNAAPDWDPNPTIDCGRGIHVVEGHPLFVHEFALRRVDPIYYEVTCDPNPPVASSSGRKYRCLSARNVRIITDDSPEFAPELLAAIAEEDSDRDVRRATVNKLNPENEKHAKLLAVIAKENSDCHIRMVAARKLR